MSVYGPFPAIVRDWHDGDTAHIDVSLGFDRDLFSYDMYGRPSVSCRLLGINAPELATDAGKAALAYVQQLCPPGTAVTVVSHGWDKYGGRWDGVVTLPDGRTVNQQMLDSGHAVPMKD